jgi:hypothetical protein
MQRLLVVLCCLIYSSFALIHDLKLKNDDRNIFKIETFGFASGGRMEISVTDVHVKQPVFYNVGWNARNKTTAAAKNQTVEENYHMGFLMRRANSESDAQQDLETIIEKGQCILDQRREEDVFLDLSDQLKWNKNSLEAVIQADSAGLYSLIFARCSPTGLHFTSFKLHAVFTNRGPNYLSAGDIPLPTIYLLFFLLHVVAFIAWWWVLSRDQVQHGTVHKIHRMMTAVLVFKILSIFSESVRYHYIAIYGVSEGWSILYYIFTAIKGIMLFTVILLIGSGYSLMKSYLNDNEKKIIMIVLILQVLDNIAMVVLEETAPGSQGWLTWRDFLHVIDILCCLAILLPIVWSMRHLR